MNRTKGGTIRIAQVGYGGWGRKLLRVLHQMDDVEVSLVIDRSAEALACARKHYPGIRVERNDDCLLNDIDTDVVVIATSASDHYRAARLALMADKHVFVETPIALTAEDAQVLVSLAQVRELTFMAGHILLFDPAVLEIKRLIDSGSLGEIYCISSRRLNLGVVRPDVNALWELGPHDASVINFWMATQPATCSASGGSFIQSGVEDFVFVNMNFRDGMVANLHLGWLSPQKVRDITIIGSKKMVVWDDVSRESKLTIFSMGVDVNADSEFNESKPRIRQGDAITPHIENCEPLVEEMNHFLQCIRTGESPLTGGTHAIDVARVLEQSSMSLKSRCVDSHAVDQLLVPSMFSG